MVVGCGSRSRNWQLRIKRNQHAASTRTSVSLDGRATLLYNDGHFTTPHRTLSMSRIQRKNFAAYIEMYPEDIGKIDALIVAIQNQLNMSRWNAIGQMFIWGFEVGMNKLEDEVLKEDVRRVLISRKLADVLDRERKHNKRIYAAVQELGYEQAVEIATREGLEGSDIKKAIERAKPSGDVPQHERANMWLLELLNDGKEWEIEDIRKEAVEAGWLPREGADEYDESYRKGWNLLRQIATKKRLSGAKRGVWQKRLH